MLPESPFKGLAYFGDSQYDVLLFFGRERESEVVAANLMASRLTVLYGPSGVGKSSLLRAGVAQRLRAAVPAVGGGDEGCRGRDRRQLARRPARSRLRSPQEQRRTSRSPTRSRSARSPRGAELYLILDQMEEYILYHGRDGGPLANALEDVLTRPDCRCTCCSASVTTRSRISTR